MKTTFSLIFLMLFSLVLLAQPSNDNHANALELTDISSWTSGNAAYTTIGATLDGVQGTCGSYANNVWFNSRPFVRRQQLSCFIHYLPLKNV